MTFFKRLISAVRFLAAGAVSFVTLPFKRIYENKFSNRLDRAAVYVSAAARVIVVVSWFVTLPAFLLAPAVIWMAVAIRVWGVIAVLTVVSMLLTDEAEVKPSPEPMKTIN